MRIFVDRGMGLYQWLAWMWFAHDHAPSIHNTLVTWVMDLEVAKANFLCKHIAKYAMKPCSSNLHVSFIYRLASTKGWEGRGDTTKYKTWLFWTLDFDIDFLCQTHALLDHHWSHFVIWATTKFCSLWTTLRAMDHKVSTCQMDSFFFFFHFIGGQNKQSKELSFVLPYLNGRFGHN